MVWGRFDDHAWQVNYRYANAKVYWRQLTYPQRMRSSGATSTAVATTNRLISLLQWDARALLVVGGLFVTMAVQVPRSRDRPQDHLM